MQLVITNVSSPSVPIYVSDLMITIGPGATVTCTRAESDLSRMVALQNYIAGGQLTMTVTPTVNEIASGALRPIPPLIAVEEWDAPATAVTNAVMHATATVNGTVTYSYQANSVVGAGYLVNPAALAVAARNVTIAGGGTTGQCPTSAVVTGLDAAGTLQTETITLTAGSGTGVKGWSAFTSIKFLGGTGTAGTEAVGFGIVIGLKFPPKTRVGQTATGFAPVFPELEDGAPAVAGSIDATHHTYTPTDAPNATHKYALYYEVLQ